MVAIDKKRKTSKTIDFVVPGDSRIGEKEAKAEKNRDLKRKLQNETVKIIPLVVGSLVAIPKQFGNRLKRLVSQQEYGKISIQLYKQLLERFSKSKANVCGLILREFSSLVLLCVSSMRTMMMMIIIIIITIKIVIIIIIITITTIISEAGLDSLLQTVYVLVKI